MTIRTTLKKLYESTAMKARVDTLAKSVGGITTYGMDTPITLEQVRSSNGNADADWVEEHTEVHLTEETAATEASVGAPAIDQLSADKKAALESVLGLPGADMSTTTNKKDRTLTASIKIKCSIGSPLAEFLKSL